MLLQLRPRSYQNYLSLPIFGSILDEFTSWSFQRGYAIWTINDQLKAARKLDYYFIRQGLQVLEELTHKSFERAWQYYHPKGNLAGTIRQIQSPREASLLYAHHPTPQSPFPAIEHEEAINPLSLVVINDIN